MSWALKRKGRFVVLWKFVLTSGRRVRGFRGLQMVAVLFRMAFFPKMLTRRAAVKKIWYDSSREDDDKAANSLAVRVFNAIMLVIVILLTLPIFAFVPQSLTPRDSPLGQIRIGIGILSCHVALVCWPCAYFIVRSLLGQKRWQERIRLVALLIVCLWCAWGATRVVIWFWTSVYHWLVH